MINKTFFKKLMGLLLGIAIALVMVLIILRDVGYY